MHTVLSIQRKQNLKGWLLLLKSVIVLLIYYFWLHFHAGKCQLMQSIFQKENADKALKYRLYRHLPAYEKIIRNLVSFYVKKDGKYKVFVENRYKKKIKIGIAICLEK